jgi:hypothetical protein
LGEEAYFHAVWLFFCLVLEVIVLGIGLENLLLSLQGLLFLLDHAGLFVSKKVVYDLEINTSPLRAFSDHLRGSTKA